MLRYGTVHEGVFYRMIFDRFTDSNRDPGPELLIEFAAEKLRILRRVAGAHADALMMLLALSQ